MQSSTKVLAIRASDKPRRKRISKERSRVARMFAELLYGPATISELVEASGLARSTVTEWISDLRETGAVRVHGFDMHTRGWAKTYVLNPEGLPDAARPYRSPAEIRERLASNARAGRARKLAAALRPLGASIGVLATTPAAPYKKAA